MATQTAGKPFLVSRARLVRLTENNSKMVWFKQGLKGAVSKVGRAFNSRLADDGCPKSQMLPLPPPPSPPPALQPDSAS